MVDQTQFDETAEAAAREAEPEAVPQILIPWTGECKPIPNTIELVAALRVQCQEHVRRTYETIEVLNTVIVEYLDKSNARKRRIGNAEFETNAPMTESYEPASLRAALQKLVTDGKLNQAAVDAIVFTPPPADQPMKVSKAELNKLKRSDDPAVTAAIVRVRRVQRQDRTVKVNIREAPPGDGDAATE